MVWVNYFATIILKSFYRNFVMTPSYGLIILFNMNLIFCFKCVKTNQATFRYNRNSYYRANLYFVIKQWKKCDHWLMYQPLNVITSKGPVNYRLLNKNWLLLSFYHIVPNRPKWSHWAASTVRGHSNNTWHFFGLF